MAKKIEYKSIELKEATTTRQADGRLKVVAYAAVFGNIDSYNDIIVKGAFANSLKKEGKRVAVCWQHDMRKPIGKLTLIEEDNNGLKVEFLISKSEEDVAVKVEEGIISEMSIGYSTVAFDYNTKDEIRTIKEARLYEVSLVTRGANEEAKIKEDDVNAQSWVVSSTAEERIMLRNEADEKKAVDFDFSNLTDAQIEILYKRAGEEKLTRLIKHL
jgi:HK97 family phage prohead protease